MIHVKQFHSVNSSFRSAGRPLHAFRCKMLNGLTRFAEWSGKMKDDGALRPVRSAGFIN